MSRKQLTLETEVEFDLEFNGEAYTVNVSKIKYQDPEYPDRDPCLEVASYEMTIENDEGERLDEIENFEVHDEAAFLFLNYRLFE